jgi:hypothetical protein
MKYRICYTAQNGSKTIHYNDDRFLIDSNGVIYENYGESWQKPMWETVFDGDAIAQLWSLCCDRNGKDIYEGDLVVYKGNRATIEFFAGAFFICYFDQTDEPLCFAITDDLKIIGNTFENPELCHE